MELAAPTLWQHLIGPVEQVEPEGVGEATARVARAAATKARVNCIMSEELSELSKDTRKMVVECSSKESLGVWKSLYTFPAE